MELTKKSVPPWDGSVARQIGAAGHPARRAARDGELIELLAYSEAMLLERVHELTKERDEARAETTQLRELLSVALEKLHDAHMREARYRDRLAALTTAVRERTAVPERMAA